ncbi:hypothetical protein HNP84_005537 [Thermocatellispora tengchongensis]|uniref:Uncharacterized protein n=1 Tax=Thermocatellispora tengchongensis TaxID=1073253 RepID=A0A840PCX9_9ACTN|nr:hypothetical protein [Thermocatellispora tengchongensis]MBB5135793.1 hypothetical protein [Thermocatellispora tengchongensis]
MTWIIVAAVLAAGLAVVAVLSARVLVAARGLGRELERTRARLSRERDESG